MPVLDIIYIDDIVHDGIGVTPHWVVISEYLGSSRRCWLVRVFSEWTMRCLSRMLSCRHFVLPCCHLNHPSIAFSIQVSWHKNWNFGSEYYSSSQIYTCLAPALQFLILSLKHKLIVTSIEAETDKNLSLSQFYHSRSVLHHITSYYCTSNQQICKLSVPLPGARLCLVGAHFPISQVASALEADFPWKLAIMADPWGKVMETWRNLGKLGETWDWTDWTWFDWSKHI